MLILEEEICDLKKEELSKVFFKDNKVNRYILGRNKNSEQLAENIDINGFIDDFTEEKLWLGKPIYKSSEVNKKNSIVVSCSLAIYPHTALKTLRNSNFEKILDYLELVRYAKNQNLKIEFLDDAKKDIDENFKKYETVFDSIQENESKKVFKDILNFRKNRELSYMLKYKVDPIAQYFEDFLNLGENEVFVDAGGFDGQTSIEFIKHCPKYQSVYIFEPDNDNLELAKKNLSKYKNINFISKGLSNQKDTLKFDTGSGSASSISENGNIEIEVDTLDDLVSKKVTFIKMDIEGSEGLAIEGMRKHILNDHPRMAISVYHKVNDFWKIPEQILAIRDDYDIYMRHYTEGTDETVMFFMPNLK